MGVIHYWKVSEIMDALRGDRDLAIFPECDECLMGMVRDLVDGADEQLRAEIDHVALEILEEAHKVGVTSPVAANQILRQIKRISGVTDPYRQVKEKEMALAQKVFSRLEPFLGKDLRSRIAMAVLGNSLDFFKSPEEALLEIPGQLKNGMTFFRDDVARLERFLSSGPELILYLADNSGEIYFDMPLYEYIHERAKRTVLVVKGGPCLNDLSRNELKAAGLGEKFREVADTGTDGVGIDWEHVSPEFTALVREADLVLSKGMANFETIYSRNLSPPVFFLFKVKCSPLKEYLDAPLGSFCALWRDGHGQPKPGTEFSVASKVTQK